MALARILKNRCLNNVSILPFFVVVFPGAMGFLTVPTLPIVKLADPGVTKAVVADRGIQLQIPLPWRPVDFVDETGVVPEWTPAVDTWSFATTGRAFKKHGFVESRSNRTILFYRLEFEYEVVSIRAQLWVSIGSK